MRVLLSTHGSRADVEPMVGLGGRRRRAAELAVAQFDTVAAAAEDCDAPVATGVRPTGVWR